MIEITLHQADLLVRHNAEGSRTIRIEDPPSGIAVMFDVPEAGLPEFVGQLVGGGLVVAPAAALGDLRPQ